MRKVKHLYQTGGVFPQATLIPIILQGFIYIRLSHDTQHEELSIRESFGYTSASAVLIANLIKIGVPKYPGETDISRLEKVGQSSIHDNQTNLPFTSATPTISN